MTFTRIRGSAGRALSEDASRFILAERERCAKIIEAIAASTDPSLGEYERALVDLAKHGAARIRGGE